MYATARAYGQVMRDKTLEPGRNRCAQPKRVRCGNQHPRFLSLPPHRSGGGTPENARSIGKPGQAGIFHRPCPQTAPIDRAVGASQSGEGGSLYLPFPSTLHCNVRASSTHTRKATGRGRQRHPFVFFFPPIRRGEPGSRCASAKNSTWP